MAKAIILFLLFPFNSLAQDKGFIHAAGSIEFPVSVGNTAFGANIGGNFKAGDGFYLGFAVGAIKFQNTSSVYIPISATFTALPLKQKTTLMFMAQPGYGVYQASGIGIPETKGGFTFYSGIGVRSKGGGFLLLGYSLYTFSYFYGSGREGLIGLRAGGTF